MTIDAERIPDIDQLGIKIDELDTEILAAVMRRAEMSRLMGRARMASGGTRTWRRCCFVSAAAEQTWVVLATQSMSSPERFLQCGTGAERHVSEGNSGPQAIRSPGE